MQKSPVKKLLIHEIPLINELSISMVEVKGGRMKIGDKNDPLEWNRVAHEVELDNFLIAKHPVSQRLWYTFMQDTKASSYWKGEERPIENISWDDSQEFIRRLNYSLELEGPRAFRLPSNAEWEYAARGGIHSRNYAFSGSQNLGKVAWYEDNSFMKTHAQGIKLPNELGLYEMSGGLWEWCEDFFGKNYYTECKKQGLLKNPKGPKSGQRRVLRGGGWYGGEQGCGVAIRSFNPPDYRSRYVGLRLSRTGL